MFIAGSLYEQEHIYTCKCFKLSFGRFFVSTIYYNSKKRPNDNLKHLHVYICSCSYRLPAINMMACLTTKYISPYSYQSTCRNLISVLVLTNPLGRHLISVLGLTNLFNHRLSPCSYWCFNPFDSTLLGRALF